MSVVFQTVRSLPLIHKLVKQESVDGVMKFDKRRPEALPPGPKYGGA